MGSDLMALVRITENGLVCQLVLPRKRNNRAETRGKSANGAFEAQSSAHFLHGYGRFIT